MAQVPPYQMPEAPAVPPRKSNTVLWVILIVAVGGACLLLPVLAAILFPVFSQARAAAQKTACLSNMKQMGVSLLMYQAENNDNFPKADQWYDKTVQESKSPGFHCPIAVREAGTDAIGYGFNKALSGLSAEKVAPQDKTVMLFESRETGKNVAGSQADVQIPGRHYGGGSKSGNYGFADGHCKSYPDTSPPGTWKP